MTKEREQKINEGFALANLCRYVYRFSKGKRHILFFYIFLFVLVNIIDQMDVVLGGYIFNYLQLHGVNNTTIVTVLLLISGFFVIDVTSWALHGPARILEQRVAFFVSNNFRDYLYKNTLDLPLTFHNEEHSGQIISKISKGTSSLDEFTSNGFLIIKSIASAVAVFIALFVYNYKFAVIGMVGLLATYFIVYLFEKTINPLRDDINKKDNILSEIIYDTISNITTIKMLSLSGVVARSLEMETSNKFKSFKRKIVLNEIKWYIPSFVGTLFIVGVLLYYVYSVYIVGTVIMVGSLYTLYSFLARLKGVLYDSAWFMSNIQNNNRNIVNSEALSDNFTEIEVFNHKQNKNIQSINLSTLNFSYNESFSVVIDYLNLEKGKSYAFVGESGCGKTTVLKILASLIHVDIYTLKVNGHEAQFPNIKDSVMLIPQEPELFSNTIRENITLGIPFPEKEIDEVLHIVNLKEVIDGLPEKIESKVFEKGVNLSGGQKQRLALARGIIFAKEKEVVLLDEPTSSVDQENEEQIYEKILRICDDKIFISSVHKKNLLKFFYYIVYFERGKIKEIIKNTNK